MRRSFKRMGEGPKVNQTSAGLPRQFKQTPRRAEGRVKPADCGKKITSMTNPPQKGK